MKCRVQRNGKVGIKSRGKSVRTKLRQTQAKLNGKMGAKSKDKTERKRNFIYKF